MAVSTRVFRGATVTVFAVVMCIVVLHCAMAHALAPAQAPAPFPSSDGTSIDQGIGYVLMFVALVLTYLIHTMESDATIIFS